MTRPTRTDLLSWGPGGKKVYKALQREDSERIAALNARLDADARAEHEVLRRQEIPATRSTARGSGGRRTVADGIPFPSRVEARVWSALVALFGRHRVRRPRALNLWSPAPDARAVPGEFRPDFAVLGGGLPARVAFYVDAKSGKRRSPEWRRGVADFRASYSEPLYEWDGTGEFPGDVE